MTVGKRKAEENQSGGKTEERMEGSLTGINSKNLLNVNIYIPYHLGGVLLGTRPTENTYIYQ